MTSDQLISHIARLEILVTQRNEVMSEYARIAAVGDADFLAKPARRLADIQNQIDALLAEARNGPPGGGSDGR